MSRVRLFEDFPPTTTEEWERKIRRDLEGVDYGETLLWHHPDGLTVRPYYRAEDSADLAISDDDPIEFPAGWKLRQDIRTPDLANAAVHARSALSAGVDMLGIDLRVEDKRCLGVPLLTREDFDDFLTGLPPSNAALHLASGVFSPVLLAFFLASHPDGGRAISLQFDPVGESARSGRRLDHLLDLAADMIRTVDGKGSLDARVLAIDSSVYHDAGATPVQENALLLAALSETLVQMIERDIRPEQVLERLMVSTRVGSSYFVEMARLRALRIVLRQLVDVFVPDESAPLPPVHGETSTRNRTLFDPNENMLRSTTEAASAVGGGCDVVAVHPHDEVAARYDEFSYRMARNIQHILRFEAGFGHVADPAAGSYYVEVLTDAMARRSWLLFQEIEAEGGFFEALDRGFIHRRLETARNERRQAFSERRAVLVGSNHYPEPDERRLDEMPAGNRGVFMPDDDSRTVHFGHFSDLEMHLAGDGGPGVLASFLNGPTLAEPLCRERLADSVERRRLQLERSGRTVRVLLIPFGDVGMRSERANFAANFLGCGGFTIDAPRGFDDVEDVQRTIHRQQPDVVVFCAPDRLYADLLSQVIPQLDTVDAGMIRGIVAGAEVFEQLEGEFVDFALHRGSHLIETLDFLLGRLGVIPAESAEIEK